MKYSQIANGLGIHLLPVLFGLIAVAFVPMDSIGFELPKLLLLTIAALLFAAVSLQRSRNVPYVCGESFLWLFAVAVTLSVLTSVAPLLSIAGNAPRYMGALAWAALLLLFFGAARFAVSYEGRHTLRYCMVFAFIPLVSHAALQWFGADPLGHLFASELFLGRVFSFAGHPNTLAQFIVLLLPLVTLYAWRTRRTVSFIVPLLGVGVLSATASRSGLLALGVMTVFVLPLLLRLFRTSDRGQRRRMTVVGALAVLLTLGVGLSAMTQRFSFASEGGRSVSSRALIWHASLNMLRERPMGYGPDTMALVSPRFLGPELYTVESLTATVDRAHNVLLDLWLATGPLGVVAFTGLMLSLLLRTWKTRHDAEVPPEAAAGSLGILGFATASFFGFPTSLSLTFFFLIAGMVAGSLAVSRPQCGSSLRRMAIVTLMVFSVLHGALISMEIIGRVSLERGQALLATDAMEGADLLLHAAMLAPFDREVLTRAAETHLRLTSALSLSDPARDLSLQKAEALLITLHSLTNDGDGTAHALSAWSAALHGDAEGVELSLAVSRSLLPWSVVVRRVAAQVRRSMGDDAGALREEQSIAELLPQEFFVEGSEARRILLKENPWLTGIPLNIAN